MCIFVKKDQCFNKIDITHHCNEQDLEICAIQLQTKTSNLSILRLYRIPSGAFYHFLREFDSTLKYLYNPKSEFLNYGDINVDYVNGGGAQ
jgi:hypothetical protein